LIKFFSLNENIPYFFVLFASKRRDELGTISPNSRVAEYS
jgi:hypothetical protein